LKQEARFFSQSAAGHLAAIFDGIDEMRTWDGKPVVVKAGPDTSMAVKWTPDLGPGL